MSQYRFANNADTTLGSAISPTATAITVASGTGAKFPAPATGQYFTATLFSSPTGLPNEIVRVTARAGDTMTVVRGQEGTTAQAWSVGDTLSNFVTAEFLNQLVDAGSLQSQSGNYAQDTGTANVAAITLTPAPASYAALVGVPIRIMKQSAANTGSYTINVNGLGSQNVLLGSGLLEGAELQGLVVYTIIYNGHDFILQTAPHVTHGDRLVDSSISNAKLVQMGSNTLKGNLSGGPATPYDVPLAALIDLLPKITGGANPSGNTSFHISIDVDGIPAPLILQAGRVADGGSNPIQCYYPVAFPNVALAGGGIPFTYSNGGFSDQDGFIGLAQPPYLDHLQFAVSRRGGDQHVDGCFWWAVGY